MSEKLKEAVWLERGGTGEREMGEGKGEEKGKRIREGPGEAWNFSSLTQGSLRDGIEHDS